MNDREKLIDVLVEVLPYSHGCPEYLLRAKAEMIADHLLANGVTIQRWIPVTERLPENRDDVLLCRKWWNEIQNPQMGWYNEVSGGWFDLSNREISNVTHWMPLPEPPKEVE